MQLKSSGQRVRVYRSVETLWAAIGMTVGRLVFIGVAAAVSKGQAGAFAVAAVILSLAWRMWLVGIRVDESGVIVGALVASRRVASGGTKSTTSQ
jgi:hypothetical protein